MKTRRWARDYERCQDCGTTTEGHHARGLCWACYKAKLRKASQSTPEHLARRRRNAARWRERQRGEASGPTALELRRERTRKRVEDALFRAQRWLCLSEIVRAADGVGRDGAKKALLVLELAGRVERIDGGGKWRSSRGA